MAEESDAKSKRVVAKRQYTRAENNLKEVLSQEDIPIATVERRYAELNKKWSDVQDTHDYYISFISDEDQDLMASEEKWMNEIQVRFSKIEIEFDKHLEKRNRLPKPTVTQLKENGESTRLANALKPDKVKFQQFNGDIRKYPQFRREFQAHMEPLYQTQQLAFVLKSYLSESVREEVESLGEDHRRVWERLDQLYGNPGKLVDAILNEIKNLPYNDDETGTTLRMIKIIEKANRDLENLGEGVEMSNATIISIIEERMPIRMKEEWVKVIASKTVNSRQKFKALMELIDDWRNRLEYINSGIRTLPEQRSESHHVNMDGQTAKQACWLHKSLFGEIGDHPIWRCREFRTKNVQERLKLLKENNACQACLLTGCPGAINPSECKKGFKCRVQGCGKDHNMLLHAHNQIYGATSHASDGLQGDVSNESTLLQLQNL